MVASRTKAAATFTLDVMFRLAVVMVGADRAEKV